jgi:uncharacterized protein (TIGR00369 family)
MTDRDSARKYGVVPLEQARSMSGREFLEAIRDGRLPAPPITRLLPFRLVEIDDGRAVFEAEPDLSLYNLIGTVHGGFAMTMLDSALACAIHSLLPRGSGYTTLETKVNFLRPILADTGKVRAEGRAVHVGRRTGLAEGEIKDVSGKVLAYGTSTCLVLSDG